MNKTKTIRTKAEDKQKRPAQKQNTQPGITNQMMPKPEDTMELYMGSGKLQGKVAIITGADSGIGRAVAIGMAKEGADIVIMYLKESADAEETKRRVEYEGRQAFLIKGDVGNEAFCKKAIHDAYKQFGRIDILVNNAGEQHPQQDIKDLKAAQILKTFQTNIFSMFFMTKYALEHMQEDSCIINTASITAYRGSGRLLDYSATKGAIVAFTRSLSESLMEKKIRVNAVAPGPIWTPLIPSTFSSQEVKKFGADTPMKRAGQPDEVAPAFIFLASHDASYISGQTIHVNGGVVING